MRKAPAEDAIEAEKELMLQRPGYQTTSKNDRAVVELFFEEAIESAERMAPNHYGERMTLIPAYVNARVLLWTRPD